jgi:hypothetical protein
VGSGGPWTSKAKGCWGGADLIGDAAPRHGGIAVARLPRKVPRNSAPGLTEVLAAGSRRVLGRRVNPGKALVNAPLNPPPDTSLII